MSEPSEFLAAFGDYALAFIAKGLPVTQDQVDAFRLGFRAGAGAEEPAERIASFEMKATTTEGHRYLRDGLEVLLHPDRDGYVYLPLEAVDRWLTQGGWDHA
jgi:hypothetical protein